MKEPCFNIYPFSYEENKYVREFKERRYIMNWEPLTKDDKRTCKVFNLYEFVKVLVNLKSDMRN